jgi:hypothetical protein
MEHVQWHKEQVPISHGGATENVNCDGTDVQMNEFVADDGVDSNIVINADNGLDIGRDDSVHSIRCVFDNAESLYMAFLPLPRGICRILGK